MKGAGATQGKVAKKRFVFRVARPVTDKAAPGYWSTRARLRRELFPSDNLVIPKNGFNVATTSKVSDQGGGRLSCATLAEAKKKVTFKTAPHLGKRDIIEYLRKVYNVKPVKVNSLNHPGKLKRVQLKRGMKIRRTSPFKKFIVRVDKEVEQSSLLPEQLLDLNAERKPTPTVNRKN